MSIQTGTTQSINDGQRLVQGFVDRQDTVRLNIASGKITPQDSLFGGTKEIQSE